MYIRMRRGKAWKYFNLLLWWWERKCSEKCREEKNLHVINYVLGEEFMHPWVWVYISTCVCLRKHNSKLKFNNNISSAGILNHKQTLRTPISTSFHNKLHCREILHMRVLVMSFYQTFARSYFTMFYIDLPANIHILLILPEYIFIKRFMSFRLYCTWHDGMYITYCMLFIIITQYSTHPITFSQIMFFLSHFFLLYIGFAVVVVVDNKCLEFTA